MKISKLTAETKFKANFLFPAELGSPEEAGFEFANARTRRYQKIWWNILVRRIQEPLKAANKCLAKYHRDHP